MKHHFLHHFLHHFFHHSSIRFWKFQNVRQTLVLSGQILQMPWTLVRGPWPGLRFVLKNMKNWWGRPQNSSLTVLLVEGSAVSILCFQEWLFGTEEESLSALLLRSQWSSVGYPVQWEQTPEGLGGKDQMSSEIHLHTINPHVFTERSLSKAKRMNVSWHKSIIFLPSSIPIMSFVNFVHISLLLPMSWGGWVLGRCLRWHSSDAKSCWT